MEFKNSSTSFEQSNSDIESEWQESSRPKYKRIRKHFKRRVESKILHTICIKYTKPNGEIQYLKHSKLVDSLEQDRNELDKEAQNLATKHSQQVMNIYYNQIQPVQQPKEQSIDLQNTIGMLNAMNYYFQSMVYAGRS